MKKILLFAYSLVLTGCASVSGPCHIGPDSAGCQEGGQMVIVIKDFAPKKQ